MIKVQKKSGETEDFDRNKIAGGLVKAGATPEQAESVTSQIEAWIQGAAVNGVIHTGQIRAKVIELLQSVNPVAAQSFSSYQKPVQPSGGPAEPAAGPSQPVPPVQPGI